MTLCLLLAVFASFAKPAAAQNEVVFVGGTGDPLTTLHDCRFHSSRSKDAPANVAVLFTGENANLVMQACTDYESNAHYFVRPASQANDHGLCRVYSEEVFVGEKTDAVRATFNFQAHTGLMAGWTNKPPEALRARGYRAGPSQALAMLTDAACPPADDPRYFSANVTDGMVRSLAGLLRRGFSSPAGYDEVFGRAKSQNLLNVESFRKNIFDHPDDPNLKLSGIDCSLSLCRAWLGQGAWHGYVIVFDVGEKGLVVGEVNATMD